MFTDEEDISNYIEFNINLNSDGTLKLLQSHLVDKNKQCQTYSIRKSQL